MNIMGRGDIMTWKNILLKRLELPASIDDWVDIFESKNTLDNFKQSLGHFWATLGEVKNENALKIMRQNIRDENYATSIVSEAGLDNKPILGQQPTGKQSDKKIVNQVQLHLKEILEIAGDSFGVSTAELRDDLLDSIVPKLRKNNPNYLEIEKEIYNFLEKTNSTNRPSIIKKPLDIRIKGKIRAISDGVGKYHKDTLDIPLLFKLFKLGEGTPYIVSTSKFTSENLIKFYRTIYSIDKTQTKALLKNKVDKIFPHLYNVRREPTEEFKNAIRGKPVSLKGFEQFGYVDVPLSEVPNYKDLIKQKVAIEDKDKLWIKIRRAKKLQKRNVISVENIGEGKPIVVNGESILSGNKLPLEKKDILDQFEDFTLDDKSLKYWAFNHVSKIEDWKTKTLEIVEAYLKNPRRFDKFIEPLENLEMIVKK